MRIKFDKKEFLKAVKVGGSFANGQKILPILGCIKVTVKGDKCWIMSYDNRNAIKTSFNVLESDGDVVFCINKCDIFDYVSSIDEKEFEMDVDNGSMTAIIRTSNGTMEFCMDDAQEYPTLTIGSNVVTFDIDASLIGYWIQRGSCILVNDDLQLNNQNMHMIIKDGKINVFFFNFNKMYHDSSEIEFDGEYKMSIDRNSFIGVRHVIESSEKITIKDGELNTVIVGGDTMVMMRKDEFKMLDYLRLLNYKPMFEVKVDKDKLESLIMRASNVGRDSLTSTIEITYSKGKMAFVANDFQTRKKFREVLETEYDNVQSDFTQIYTVNLFKMILGTVKSDKVLICPTGDKSLLIFKNTEYETENSFLSPCN